MATKTHTLDPEELTDEERQTLQRQVARLQWPSLQGAGRAEGTDQNLVLQGEEGASVSLPDSVARAVMDMLAELAAGHSVSVGAAEEELTTREAAELLNVSRPHLVKLLEEGKIPFHKVGTHRRVRRRDVLAYKARRREEAEDALQKLADQAQDLGLGY